MKGYRVCLCKMVWFSCGRDRVGGRVIENNKELNWIYKMELSFKGF